MAQEHDALDIKALGRSTRKVFTVRRVFGEAYERDGVTVIPVAKVMGGGGSGFGTGAMGEQPKRRGHGGPTGGHAAEPAGTTDPTATDDWAGEDPPEEGEEHHAAAAAASGDGGAGSEGAGGGAGFGVRIRPVGVYVITRDGDVQWRPSLDLNRIILGGQIVGLVVGVAVALALRSRWSVPRVAVEQVPVPVDERSPFGVPLGLPFALARRAWAVPSAVMHRVPGLHP